MSAAIVGHAFDHRDRAFVRVGPGLREPLGNGSANFAGTIE